MPRIHFHSVEIEGPLPVEKKSVKGQVFLGERQDDISIIRKVAKQAFRMSVSEDDLQIYYNLAEKSPEGLKVALTALLSSPHFLYHHEPVKEHKAYILANRLSYMLWCSLPDEELFELAKSGELLDENIWQQQVERMLRDERSKRFVKDFSWQWLGLQNVLDMPSKFGLFSKDSFFEETRHFLQYMLDENLLISQFIDADFTFVNSQLASFYGLPERPGRISFTRVSTKGTNRGGLISQAAVLAASTNGVETSPVTRGVWFLEHILGIKPTIPPDLDFPEVDTRGAKTVKQILARHQEDKNCQHCHKKIDYIGFAFEGFGVNGDFRKRYPRHRNGLKLETHGTFESGESFKDFSEFKNIMLKKTPQVAEALVKKLLSYGTGKKITGAHKEEVDQIMASLAEQNYRFRDLVYAVLSSPLFLR